MILGITLTSVVILACAIIFAYLCRRKITHKKGNNFFYFFWENAKLFGNLSSVYIKLSVA